MRSGSRPASALTCPACPGDRDRLVAEIRVAGDRRQCSAACAGRAGTGVSPADERIHQVDVLRRIARHLLNDLLRVALEGGLLRLLPIDLGLARSKNQLKIHNLIVAGCVQNGFLRPSSERRELSADNVTAVLRNIQLPRTGNVSGRGVALAGECVLRGDGDARQRDSAAFDHAMEFAAGDGFGRGRGCLD